MEITSPELLGLSSHRLRRIKPVLQRYVDQGKFAGFITLVARHGKVAHYETTGYADIATAKPMPFDALFRMYSSTKPVTSTAMMMLFEEGRFRLSDPVYDYLPAFKTMQVFINAAGDTEPAQRAISIFDLFTHTAGLGYGIGSTTNALSEQLHRERYWSVLMANDGTTLETLINNVAQIPLVSQPGAAWIYSLGIDVLGLLVQVLSGMSLAAYLKRNLFDPLGMPDTGFYAPPDKVHRLATCYGPKIRDEANPLALSDLSDGIAPIDAFVTNGSWTEPTNSPSGGGGLVSSTADYYRFAQMLANKGALDGVRILGRKTVEMMFTNQLPAGMITSGLEGFGLGGSVQLAVPRMGALTSPGTWGWGGAANTEFWIDPVEDMVCLLNAQYLPGGSQFANIDFRNLAYAALVD